LTNTYAATLRTAFFPRSILTSALLVVGGAALVAICAQVSISLPFTPVPVTGQTFAVVLVGASLGPISGAASLTLYLMAGVAGAPIYADGTHGWDVVMSATGGYLIGFVLAASLTGALAARAWDRRVRTAMSAMLAGNVVIYVVGLPWLAWKLGADLETTLELGLYPFVVGDLLKLYLAALVLPLAWRIKDSRSLSRREG
jgi:biotin transport system substrate-specific component